MRHLNILAIVLIVVGGISLAYRSITFFTQEKGVDAGPLELSVSKPQTIFLNPIIGAVMVGTGVVVLATNRKSIDA